MSCLLMTCDAAALAVAGRGGAAEAVRTARAKRAEVCGAAVAHRVEGKGPAPHSHAALYRRAHPR